MENIEVVIEKYNENWVKRYHDEKQIILKAVGAFLVGIQHIGSTSIKGLGAKPIIDIMAGVHDLANYKSLVEPLNSIDYEYVSKENFPDRKFFRKGPWGKGTVHLHVCEHKSLEWEEKILFRDYLRNHPNKRDEYFNLKNALAQKYKLNRSAYTEAKTEFIRNIISLAKKII
ncbi:GrpB family protein [Metabacillus arenae]|uniref:GrpB family protein n=1 Tax=Metabacillus arenae TaxID=2771434 RepID=A0A926NKR9_9BACI|nr:GrpB family protein [Metabacillus arenae]MBD1382855.1 GrpB family protein [Metabacillus arenae]